MANRMTALVFVVLIFAPGCVQPNSFFGYLEDRRHDLIDAGHVTLSRWESGLAIYAGPIVIANDNRAGRFAIGIGGGSPPGIEIGLGGYRESTAKGELTGGIWPIFPVSRWNRDKPMFYGGRPKSKPSLLSAGFSLGIILGVGAHADAYELADFALGLFGFDIGGDDENVFRPEEDAETGQLDSKASP